MTEININSPAIIDAEVVITTVERTSAEEALHITMKSALKKFPGCTHWHFKRQDERGILEVTWWPADHRKRTPRLWLSIHNNRKADWMLEAIPRLREKIEAQLLAVR